MRPLCTEGITDKRIMLIDWEKNLYSHLISSQSYGRLSASLKQSVRYSNLHIKALNSLQTTSRAREAVTVVLPWKSCKERNAPWNAPEWMNKANVQRGLVYDAADGKNVVNDHHPHSNKEAACF